MKYCRVLLCLRTLKVRVWCTMSEDPLKTSGIMTRGTLLGSSRADQAIRLTYSTYVHIWLQLDNLHNFMTRLSVPRIPVTTSASLETGVLGQPRLNSRTPAYFPVIRNMQYLLPKGIDLVGFASQIVLRGNMLTVCVHVSQTPYKWATL